MNSLDQLIELQAMLIKKDIAIPQNNNDIQPCAFTSAYVEAKKNIKS